MRSSTAGPDARRGARLRAHRHGDRGSDAPVPARPRARPALGDRERDRRPSDPSGSYVVVSQLATHRHPQFWDDAEAFDPTRFTPERECARHPYPYFPFGAGPRACIGSHFAMFEATIAAALRLQRFLCVKAQAAPRVDPIEVSLLPCGQARVRVGRLLTPGWDEFEASVPASRLAPALAWNFRSSFRS